jgi:hypothetical protein
MLGSRVLMQVLMVLIVSGAILAGTPAAEARLRTVTKRHDVAVSCVSHDGEGFCEPVFWVALNTVNKLVVSFPANPDHCTPIAIRFAYDGVIRSTRYPLAPGGKITADFASIVTSGAHTIGVIAQDWPGGPCQDGPLSSYEGKLKVETNKRVRR